jgi:peptidyl-prolyl cis-trans isomerase D
MAMMGWMRRSSKYFLIVVVVTFVASLAYFGATQDRSEPQVVASVDGDEISVAEYERVHRAMLEQYRQVFKERLTDEMLRSLRLPNQVVERLVTERVVRHAAAREGIVVSDAEVADEIYRQAGQRLSRDQYRRMLARMQLTEAVFEEGLRQELLQRKLRALVQDGVKVSEPEVRQHWESRRERVRAAYLVVSPEPFRAGVEVTEAALEAYHKAHTAEFTRPERRRALLAVVPTASVPVPTVSDADVEAAYRERLAEFEQPTRRRVAHLLVRVPPVGGSEAEDGARAKAEAALQRIKGGADFGQVAREVSEDAATASRGGELGLVAPGEVVPAFEKAAFALGAGEVSGPVRTPFGYHVIKVLEVVPGSKKELKEVAGTLRATLQTEGHLRALRDRADEAQQALLGAQDFAAEARRRGLTVREVGPFGRNDPIEGLGRLPDATAAVFALAAGGTSQAIKVPEGYAVFRLLEREEPRLLPLSEVRAAVTQGLQRQKAQEAAAAKAGQLAEALRQGEDPRAVARREGVGAGETPPFSRAEPLADQELARAVGKAALELPVNGVGGPATGAKGVYVVKVLERERPDPAGFEGARQELTRQLLEQKRTQAWQSWVQGGRARASIEINRQILPDA